MVTVIIIIMVVLLLAIALSLYDEYLVYKTMKEYVRRRRMLKEISEQTDESLLQSGLPGIINLRNKRSSKVSPPTSEEKE